MSEAQKITIIQGDAAKEHLSDPVLIRLTNRVNKMDVDEEVGLLRHEAACRAFDALADRGDKGTFDEARAAAGKIDPAFGPIHHMKHLRDRGDIAIAKEAEKTVGMVGFQLLRADSATGRNIYELRRLGVLKEYEGRGIGAALQKAMFERIRRVDPNGIILVEAQNPAVVTICRKMGFRECTMDEGVRLKCGDEGDDEYRAYCEKTGAVFLVYEPAET